MKVHLTRNIWIEGTTYPAGPNEIPDEKLKTPDFVEHIKAGHITEPPPEVKHPTPVSNKERADALLAKVTGKAKKDLAGGDDEAPADESPAPKSKNKNKN